MEFIPHSHLGMSGRIQKHMLVYVITIAIVLTIFFDLSRIASIGAIFYLVMDMIIHWGVLKFLRKDVGANAAIVITALIFDFVVLLSFLYVKTQSDIPVVAVSPVGILLVFILEYWFIKKKNNKTMLIGIPRSDTGAFTSFPSGHTAQAFMAATYLHKEIG